MVFFPNIYVTKLIDIINKNIEKQLNLDKCLFCRVATPFGGFDKAPRGITFKLPEVNLNAPRYPELQDHTSKRPTFNRTAQGWISEGLPVILPTVSLEPFEIPESEDL